MNKPILNIKYGKLLDPFFKEYVSVKYPDAQIPKEEDVLDKVKVFKDVWKKEGSGVIDFLYTNTGMEFKRNIIDCFIVSSTPRDMNSPMVIRSRYNNKEFIYTVLHELIHTLFSENRFKVPEKYIKESKTTKNHIALFALVEKYILEEMKDSEFLKEIKKVSNTEVNREYGRAWEIVTEEGCEEVLKMTAI